MRTGNDRTDEVRRAYDEIAPHFDGTRIRVWPPTDRFLKEIAPCRVGDLGCGNGRATERALELGCEVVAVDSSEGQLRMAKNRVLDPDKVEFYLADIRDLPLDDRYLDAAILIAALHHIQGRSERVRALKEIGRCVREDGRLQISVWSWDQERFRNRYMSRISGDSDWEGKEPGDFIIPWKKGIMKMRYYHLYGPGELELEVRESGWFLQRSYFDGRNHWTECIMTN